MWKKKSIPSNIYLSSSVSPTWLLSVNGHHKAWAILEHSICFLFGSSVISKRFFFCIEFTHQSKIVCYLVRANDYQELFIVPDLLVRTRVRLIYYY